MVGEWIRKFSKKEKKVVPESATFYVIPEEVINYTLQVLKGYGSLPEPAEGVVYWAGTIDSDKRIISAVVVPQIIPSRYGFSTSHDTNAKFVEFIRSQGLVYLCQVHSHPGSNVNHSTTDDKETAFRREGLISIVIPSFGNVGMKPFTICGVHIFTKGSFFRIKNAYVKKHFKVPQLNSPIITKDLRDGNKL